jgi:GABA permease
VANVTAGSPELLGVLRARAERGPTAVYLVVPAIGAGGDPEKANATLENALDRFRGAGLEADGGVGPNDPLFAVSDVWHPGRYDEIIVSTLPMRVSKWLHAGLPERIGRTTGALVTHVVSEPPRDEVRARPAPPHEHLGVLTPFAALGRGGAHEEPRRPGARPPAERPTSSS